MTSTASPVRAYRLNIPTAARGETLPSGYNARHRARTPYMTSHHEAQMSYYACRYQIWWSPMAKGRLLFSQKVPGSGVH